jgi:hypothetical protein
MSSTFTKVDVKSANLVYLSRYYSKAVKYLVDRFGVPSKVYAPIRANTSYTGYDDAIEYNPVPIYDGKLFLPSLYQTRSMALSQFIDDYSQNEQFIYMQGREEPLPQDSFVVAWVNANKTFNFKIVSLETTVDTMYLYFKAKVVPALMHESLNNPVEVPVKTELSEAELFVVEKGTIAVDQDSSVAPEVSDHFASRDKVVIRWVGKQKEVI